ncbi:putative RNA editing 3 terminal uridylyl transferase 1 [Trypanosoma grayi]|uniref:putative RNA editing 3 terminal uridylyl transferase 1 n=1 Tax=Trypanosoma grayi TaxID=71804 RepID=UPI0004F46B33|nr:putative RNA editing 3 terminal uridylyl transferase 1 [Trypanosoma grayi]KEG07578.1 putative RNA editing 3 terminal uridylyl transferase 1 [Trypanosoma grayi]
MTLDSTTTAIRAAMCTPALVTPTLRVKVQPMHDECRPELYNIDFDLSFRAFGIRNSQLLRQYLLSHPCARPGAVVLKDWSKTSGVNNSVNGYFTSYAINIMWIYYLIQKKHAPYVDPLDIPVSLVDYTDLDPTYTPMIDPALTPAELDTLYKEAGEMLVGFFYFYSFEFDWEHHVVSLNRPGITTKKMLGWHVEDVVPPMSSTVGSGGGGGGNSSGGAKRHPTRYELCIEDPYEENLNLGRHIGITKSLRVRTELYRGLLSLLKDGEKESCVFASTDLAESNEGVGSSPSGLPARALFKLMALTTQAIAEPKSLSGGGGGGGAGNGIVGNGTAVSAPVATSARSAVSSSSSSTVTGIAGVPEERLESLFREKASLEYQLARKAWNWQQLIHRLGYKIHRGHVLPRREIGVRCVARREDEESPNGTSSSSNNNSGSRKPPGAQGRHLTEGVLRDLSRGFMTLTPEWVAWSTPWVSQHLRGYSRLTTLSGDAAVAASANSNATAAGVPATPSSGEVAMGAIRGTRRNAAPMGLAMTRAMMVRTSASTRGTATAIFARLGRGVRRVVPLRFIR